jgi:excisionase family DNA binding protein
VCERLLTVQEASEALNLKPRTLYAAIERGDVPYLRIGRLVRLSLPEVVTALRVGDRR